MVEREKIKNVLRSAFRAHGLPKHSYFATFSFNPPTFQDVFREAMQESRRGVTAEEVDEAMKNCAVFFQRFSFRTTSQNAAESPYRGRKRTAKINQFKHGKKTMWFRVRGKNPPWHQLHLKVALLLWENNYLLIQFSKNLDLLHSQQPEIVYSGKPQNSAELVALLITVLQRNQGFVEDMNGRRQGMSFRQLVIQRLQQSIPIIRGARNVDPLAFFVVQNFARSMAQNLKEKLVNVKQNANDSLYKGWDSGAKESVLLLHFPYVHTNIETNLCRLVVDPVSFSEEERKRTRVELAYSSVPNRENFQHESWICRLDGRRPDSRILFFALVSANLTLPSWRPQPEGPDPQEEPPGTIHRYNLESGVLVFDHRDPTRTPFSQGFRQYIQRMMRPSDTTTLSNVLCNVDKASIPDVPDDALDEENLGTCSARDLRQYQAIVANASSTWQRFAAAKKLLVHGMLKGLVGTGTLMDHDLMRYSYHFRYALFDYLFHDLAKYHPVSRLGVYDEAITKKYFLYLLDREGPDNHPWIACRTAETTLNMLVDIYVRWSIAFDMYDPRIKAALPEVNEDTLVSLAEGRVGEQIVEDHGQNNKKPSTYDTVSFLMQSLNAKAHAWWKCPKGHGFYWTPRNMMLRMSACPVCVKYHDIRLLYEIVKGSRGVDRITVEFPLMRKATIQDRYQVDIDAQDPIEMDKVRNLMKYDIMFRLTHQNNHYICAIEFDDISHNSQPQNIEAFINVNQPSADAAKNILSTAMGIHLMRVWASKNRPNAKSRLQLMVDYFLDKVRNDNKTVLPLQNINDFVTRVRKFHTPARQLGYLVKEALTHRQNARVTEDSRLRRVERQWNLKCPVSIIFDTDVPVGRLTAAGTQQTLLTKMLTEGAENHPCSKNNLYRVQVEKQVDDTSLKTYHVMLNEWLQTYDHVPPHFVLANQSYNGRLMDEFEGTENGLAMISQVEELDNGVQFDAYRLEPTAISPWQNPDPFELPKALFRERRDLMPSIATHFVRLLENRKRGNMARFPGDGGGGGGAGGGGGSGGTRRNDNQWEGVSKIRKALGFAGSGAISGGGGGGGSSSGGGGGGGTQSRRVSGWSLQASWALPPNKIRYDNPAKRRFKETLHWESGNFARAEVVSVKQSREYGQDDFKWWIGVKRTEDSPIKYIEEKDFSFVFRPSQREDQRPLSEFVQSKRNSRRDRQIPAHLDDFIL